MRGRVVLSCLIAALAAPAVGASGKGSAGAAVAAGKKPAKAPSALAKKSGGAVGAAGRKPAAAPSTPGKIPAGAPSAAQIAERNVAARGGLARWRAVSTLRMSGELDAGGTADPKLPFVLALKRPHKSRLELTFAGKNAVQTYDGVRGWKLRPFLNREDAEPFTSAEAKAAESFTELDGPLVDYAKRGTKIALVGVDRVEGRKAYKLKLSLKDGAQRFLWVDAGTFLEAKISGEPRKLDGRPHDVAIYYRDYRTVNGLKLPYVLETRVEGVEQPHRMTIQSVTVNPPLEDALFAKPTAAMARAQGARRTP